MITILQGDVIEQLRTLPNESVHCCVTSPPYWGLRDYGTAQWEGGEDDCDHAEPPRGGRNPETAGKQLTNAGTLVYQFAQDCGKCGAKRIDSQLGLEKTPDCGRPLAKLISELTSSQVAFVRQRLSDAGLLDAFPNGMGGTTQQRSQSRSEVQDDHPTTSNDEPEGVRRASDNLGKSSRRASGQPSEIHDKQASCNPSLSPENVRLSNSDYEIRQDENYGADDSQHALRHDQSPVAMPDLVAYPTERDLSTSQLSSAHFPSSSETGDSQPLQDPKALREQQDSLPDYHGDSSKSSRKNYRKSKVRDRDTFFDIGDKLWAWYSLPQDVTRFYESQLCGECYVCKMVEVFREVRRVLRKDGTLWLNLGDSYASASACDRRSIVGNGSPDENCKRPNRLSNGLKEKDLCGIPWRLAFALQADGWWLRSDIIWAKPNPMPESVTDRPTKAHEYLFLLTKSANYFYDAEAIKEGKAYSTINDDRTNDNGHRRFRDYPSAQTNGGTNLGGPEGSRNKRSVWTVATAPYPEAHFATYPPDLIKPCILAGTSAKGCCAKCGSPWERIVERSSYERRNHTDPKKIGTLEHHQSRGSGGNQGMIKSGKAWNDFKAENPDKTIGWQPTCECYGQWLRLNPDIVSCTVLDPFAGSGTTGAVALELGRKAVLIELNPKYVELIERRCSVTMGLPLAV